MANLPLEDFISGYRDELIRRCREKVAGRSSPLPTEEGIDHGVPQFLDQLCQELRQERSSTPEISHSAMEHGHDLLLQGFTISQVVHAYGDICQSVTDLAVEMGAPIGTDDFRTMNRCLDNAIAAAVSEFAHGQNVSRYGASQQLQALVDAAITAFDMLRTGRLGIGGSTGTVVRQSLLALRAALVEQRPAEEPTQARDARELIPARFD
jgi:hypothetical protein